LKTINYSPYEYIDAVLKDSSRC